MTRHDRILVLLEHYRDVLEGLRDRQSSDGYLVIGMCRAWNHASYQELERLLPLLRERMPRLHDAVVTRYLGYFERRVGWCRKCEATLSTSRLGKAHGTPAGYCRLKGVLVMVEPRVVRIGGEGRDADLRNAVEWLERHWRGEVEIPADVQAVESERKLRAVA